MHGVQRRLAHVVVGDGVDHHFEGGADHAIEDCEFLVVVAAVIL